MAAEDAGSIYSEVRIKIDQLQKDIATAVSVMDRFGQKVVDSGNIASNLFSNSYSQSVKKVESYVKSLDKAVADGALTQRQAISSAIDARKAELAYIQATAARKGGFTDQEIGDLKRVKTEISSLTEQQKKLGSEVEKSSGSFKLLALAASTFIITQFRALITSSAAYSEALGDLRAATKGNAEGLDELAKAAEGAGKSVAASSTQAIEAEVALAKAGVSTANILGGALTGALTLAAAGTMEVADAAEIAAATMTQFNLDGQDVVHIADLLAAGAGKAQGEVSDLSQALKQAGLVASQTGLSVDDTVGTLAAFASAGLLGSDAGTSFRTMLLRLTPQSKEAAGEMKRLGLNAFDAKGEFIGIEKFAGQLKDQLSDLTTEQRNSALATIFGTDSIRAANVLYTQGAKGISEWIGKVNDTGFAAEVARIKLDNLAGDLKKLDAQVATSSAKIGGSLDPSLRGLAQGATAFLDFLDDIPAPIAAFITAAGTLASGIVAVTLGVGFLTPALAMMGITVSAAFGPIALAVGAVTALAGGIIAMTNAVNAADVEKAGRIFGDIAVEAGLSGEELAKFNQRASDAEKFLRAMELDGMASAKSFETLAKDLGLTNDQLAQIAIRSRTSGQEIKNIASGYLDGAAAAKRFAEANVTLALTLRDSWRSATPAEIKKVEDALTGIPVAVEDASALTASELEELTARYRATADRVADIVGYMRATREKESIAEADAIASSNETIIGSYAYAQNRVRGIIEARIKATAKEEEKVQLETNVKLAESILNTFSGLTNALADIFASLSDKQINALERVYDHERELIENNGLTKKQALEKDVADAITAGDATAQADAQRALDLYNLEADFTRKKAQLEYEAAMTQWKFNLVIAAANAANSILKAVASAAFPLNIPAIAFASLVGGAQTAAVFAAQPQPPAFATGGIVLPSGNAGRQVTVADKDGGEIMFGTGAMGAPMMQAFVSAVASEVVSRLSGMGKPLTIQVDGHALTTVVVKYVDDGLVKARFANR
jgi:TP901 family phage tail tape measure protein